jgi:hypothetical protein
MCCRTQSNLDSGQLSFVRFLALSVYHCPYHRFASILGLKELIVLATIEQKKELV